MVRSAAWGGRDYPLLTPKEVNAAINAQKEAARQNGVESTPSVFINGRHHKLSIDKETLAHAVDAKDQVTHDHTRRVQDQVNAFHIGDGRPQVVHGSLSRRRQLGQRRNVFSISKSQCGHRAKPSSCSRPHHPPGIQSGSPAVTLQSGPFHRPRNRHGQRGPIGRTQDAAVGVENAQRRLT